MIILQHRRIVEVGPQTWVEPATGKCSCGTKIVLSDPLDNVCPSCGKCYNYFGQVVTPSWGCDETGEPFSTLEEENEIYDFYRTEGWRD